MSIKFEAKIDKIEIKDKKPIIINLKVYDTERECACVYPYSERFIEDLQSYLHCSNLENLNDVKNDRVNHFSVEMKGYMLIKLNPLAK